MIGLVSFGTACGIGNPTIFIRVSACRGWIESIVWPGSSGENVAGAFTAARPVELMESALANRKFAKRMDNIRRLFGR